MSKLHHVLNSVAHSSHGPWELRNWEAETNPPIVERGFNRVIRIKLASSVYNLDLESGRVSKEGKEALVSIHEILLVWYALAASDLDPQQLSIAQRALFQTELLDNQCRLISAGAKSYIVIQCSRNKSFVSIMDAREHRLTQDEWNAVFCLYALLALQTAALADKIAGLDKPLLTLVCYPSFDAISVNGIDFIWRERLKTKIPFTSDFIDADPKDKAIWQIAWELFQLVI